MTGSIHALTPRLRAVADFVPPGGTLADIGTDHAYIPIALAGRVKHAIASDIRPGPLERAAHNISRHGLAGCIETRLAGGLSGLRPGEADTIVVAGMGGLLIADILQDGEAAARAAGTLVLQPMTAVYELRCWLAANGYVIRAEQLAREGDKLYHILCCTPGASWTDEEVYLRVGRALFVSHDPLLPLLLGRMVQKQETVVAGMQRAASDMGIRLHTEQALLEKLRTLRSAVMDGRE